MTLAELVDRLPLPYEEAVGYGLVFPAAVADAIASAQAENPTQFLAMPRTTTDGRYLLCGDLLTELPYGLYWPLATIDPALFLQVLVVPWAEAVGLLPPLSDDA